MVYVLLVMLVVVALVMVLTLAAQVLW